MSEDRPVIRTFHLVLGLAVLVLFAYILFNLKTVAPEFSDLVWPDISDCPIIRCGGFIWFTLFAFALPVISVACFIMPGFLSYHLSPRSGFFGHRILTEGFFYIVGYVALGVSAFVYNEAFASLF